MNAIVSFAFEDKPVRVIQDAAGEAWFVASEVCRVLEINNSRQAVRILDSNEKGVSTKDTLGGMQDVVIISEAGLYKLMGRSRKAQAKRFDRWVRHEVLPSIRKTGGYGVRDIAAALNDPGTLRRLLLENTEKMLALEADKAVMAPKVEALGRIATADGSLCITDAAKTLQVRPIDLIQFMLSNGWIYSRRGRAVAYQSKINAGLLEHKVVVFTHDNGAKKTVSQARGTAKGLTMLAEMLPRSTKETR